MCSKQLSCDFYMKMFPVEVICKIRINTRHGDRKFTNETFEMTVLIC